YPIALAFKIIGRCRSITEAKEMAIEYKNFISSLPISTEAKIQEDGPYAKPWTTNNFTKRMNKTIEERYSGTQTVLTFIEHIYGIKNSRTIEHQNGQYKLQPDVTHRINQGKLKVLQNSILEISNNLDFLYVRMNNSKQNTFRSPYMTDKIKFEDNEAQGVSKMIKKLAAKHMVPILPNYYLINHITGECTCLDFIWHRSFRDFSPSIKNEIIYTGSDEESYAEILHQYRMKGDAIFFPTENK
ncbi:23629_t:CDS:2, partial [Gigaspora rosea]